MLALRDFELGPGVPWEAKKPIRRPQAVSSSATRLRWQRGGLGLAGTKMSTLDIATWRNLDDDLRLPGWRCGGHGEG